MEGSVDAYLGVDVGSVSTNLVLLSPDGKVYEGIYLPTRGRPIEAIGQGLDMLRDSVGERLHVLGVAVTGSGRHLAGHLLGASWSRTRSLASYGPPSRLRPTWTRFSRSADRIPSTSTFGTGTSTTS